MQDEAPVAELVAEALDEQGGVARHGAGGLLLVGDEPEQVVDRPRVETGLIEALADGGLRASGVREFVCEGADRLAEFGGTTQPVALPERHAPRLPEGWADQHAIGGDLLDAPAGGAEREDVADARLVDHLLVELADASP